MYTAPWIPRADAQFALFAQAFCNGINKTPAKYMMEPAEAKSLMDALSVFLAALATATEKTTRTSGTITAKRNARSILQGLIVDYAAFIRVNKGIVDEDKIDISVRPRNIAHADRTCPQTSPVLQFIGSQPGIDVLRYHDSNTPTSKAKPRGAERLELWVAHADRGQPWPKVSEARLVGSFKKSKMLVERPEQFEGMQATYWARWGGYDGEVGPWSLPCSLAGARKKSEQAAAKTKPKDDDQSLKMAA